MEIAIPDKKLRKVLNDQKLLMKMYGAVNGRMIRCRLDEFMAAANLSVIATLPQANCHELKGDRRGQLAVSVKYPQRLIFLPSDPANSKKADGGLNWLLVTSITVIGIEDYHGD